MQIGSCRVNFKIKGSHKTDEVGFIHGLDEHIQFINMLRGNIKIPRELYRYIFTNAGGLQKKPTFGGQMDWAKCALSENPKFFILEVCTMNVYDYKGYYFQKSRYENRNVWKIEPPSCEEDITNNLKIYKHTEETFEQKFVELIEMLGKDTEIVFIGIPNVILPSTGKCIPERVFVNAALEKLVRRYTTSTSGHGYKLNYVNYLGKDNTLESQKRWLCREKEATEHSIVYKETGEIFSVHHINAECKNKVREQIEKIIFSGDNNN
jgi:hypothetical protein